MNKVVKSRMDRNLKKQLRYLSLIFNDFFVLALIFLFGAFMFWYAQNIKKWPVGLWFYSPLIALIFTITMGFGNLATLIKEPDEYYLFNQDEEMKAYFKPLLRYSMILPIILIILVSSLLFPFVTISNKQSFVSLICITLGSILAKNLQFNLIIRNFYFDKKFNYNYWLFLLANFLFILLGLKTMTVIYLIIVVVFRIAIKFLPNEKAFDWYSAVEYEERRRDTLDSFYSMFTDVAEKKVKISRRKYLDFLLSFKNQTPNTYLYQRALLRDPEYSNLLIRMTTFSLLLSMIIQDYLWATVLGALVIFLTIYQLIPLGTVYEHNMMYHVQPIPFASRAKDLGYVLQKAMLLQWVIISLGILIFSPEKSNAMIATLVLLVFVLLLLYAYLTVRIEKLFRKVRF